MHSIEIIHLLACLLPCVGLWIIVFRSPLQAHLLERFVTREPMTSDDVDIWLAARGSFGLLTLRNCVWCQAFWTTVSACLLYPFIALHGTDILWGLLALPVRVLSLYPITCYILWKLRNLER